MSITIDDIVIDESSSFARFTVRLTEASAQTVSVSYNNSNGTAANGSDYTHQSGTLNFAPGQTELTIDIPILGNAVLEGVELFRLNLSNPVNATIIKNVGWATIVDNDATTGTPVVRVGDQVVDEAAGTVTFVVTLDKPSTDTVNVDYATANGTALAGSDYVAQATQTLSFLAGEVVKTVTIDLINDAAAEGREYFDLVLTNPVGATLLPQAHGRASIGANDAPAVAAPRITVSDAVAGESDGYLQFVVSLSAPSTQTVSVSYNNSNATAANGSDYLAQSGTVTFAPGQTTQTVLIPLDDNTTLESTEYLTLNLFNAVNGSIAREPGWGTIVDNDATTGTPVVRVGDQVVDEAAGTVTFVVTLDKPSTDTVNVDYATANGTALAGSDYVAQATQTLSFLAGEVVKTVTIDLINDAAAEGREYFDLVLTNPVGATLLPQAHGRASIGANDAPAVAAPRITVSDAVAGESDGYLQFVVSLSAPSTQTVSVSYNNSNATAANGSDYLAQSGTVTFAPGQTTQTVLIPLDDNTTLESTEYLTLNLFNAVNGSIAREPGWGTIVDNDATTGTPVVRVGDQVVDEAAGTVTFVVTLDKPSTDTVNVDYATANGTALAGSDYVAQATQTLSFLAGEVVKTVTIDLINDAAAEGREYFDLVLTNPVGATLLPQAHGRASIGANDAPAVAAPRITVSDAVAGESDGYLQFVVSLSAPSTQTVSVSYNNSNATAANGSDYLAQSGTVTFAPGQTTQTVLIPLDDNTTLESTEYLTLNLFNAVNGSIAREPGWGTIVDNDATTGTPVVRVGDQVVDEAAGTVTFVVTLDKPSTDTVNVDYATANGTALAGSDYVAQATQTLSFLAGEVVKTVTIDLINDAGNEPGEFFDLVLSSPVGATLPDANARVFIGPSDAPAVAAPRITVSDAVAGESDGYLQFVVSLSAPSTQTVSVSYNNSNATAANGSDYLAQSGTVTFAPGQTTQTVLIPLVDNTTEENTEYLTLNLFNAVNGSIAREPGWGSIVDNDATTGTPALSVSDGIVDESAARTSFTVTLDRPSTDQVSVSYAPAEGNARAGSDYETQGTQTLVFAPGEVTKTVIVNLRSESLNESAEFFDLVLSNPTNATIADVRGHMFFPQNDGATTNFPTIAAAAISATEGDGHIDFVVSLSAPSTQTVSVGYNNSNATAANGSDYLAQSGTVTFAPGVTIQTVRIPILDNVTVEATETFTLNLFNPVNAQVGTPAAVASIIDDDGAPPASQLIVAGTANAEILIGRPGANAVDGGQGNDALDGVNGVRMRGGVGNDLYVVESGADTVIEAAGAGTDTVVSYINYTLGAEVENLMLRGPAINGTGNGLNNVISGNALNNSLTGAGGTDTVSYLYATTPVVVNLVTGMATGNGTDTLANFENVEGSDFADVLTGDANANVLNGGKGADALTGLGGGDTYVVDNAGDVVTEAAVAGVDLIQSSVTILALAANVENLTLTGTLAINGNGNTLANTITGNSAANTLNGDTGEDTLIGGAGADNLNGGLGNDTYMIDASDVLTDSGGIETVQAGFTYALLAGFEKLTLTGALAINGTGNTLANTITGNNAANVLNGGVGADSLNGGLGNDTYMIDASDALTDSGGSDTVQAGFTYTLLAGFEKLTLTGALAINGTGNTLANTITGNNAANVLKGGKENDTLLGLGGGDVLGGGAGRDTLTGGSGLDKYDFNTALSAATNVDRITNYSLADDLMRLDNDFFVGLATGALAGTRYYEAAGATGAHDASDRIIYNLTNGNLYFDADGTGGAASAVLFATLTGAPNIGAADFLIIA